MGCPISQADSHSQKASFRDCSLLVRGNTGIESWNHKVGKDLQDHLVQLSSHQHCYHKLLNHISWLLIQTPLEHCQGWRLHHLPGQPFQACTPRVALGDTIFLAKSAINHPKLHLLHLSICSLRQCLSSPLTHCFSPELEAHTFPSGVPEGSRAVSGAELSMLDAPQLQEQLSAPVVLVPQQMHSNSWAAAAQI